MTSRIKHLEGKFDDLICCIVVSILHHHGNQQFPHQQLSNETKAHTLKFLTLKLNALQRCNVWCEMFVPLVHLMDFAKHKAIASMGITCVWDRKSPPRYDISKKFIDQGLLIRAPNIRVCALIDTRPKLDMWPTLVWTFFFW